MALPTTYALTDPILSASLSRSLGQANTIFTEDEMLQSTDNLTYFARRGLWQTAPPPVLMVNGVPATGFSTNLTAGSITFAASQDPMAIVTASYACLVFSPTDLESILTDAFFRIEAALAYDLDDTLVPRALLPVIVTVGHILALRTMMTERLDNYMWEIEGKRVDKSRVSGAFLNSIKVHEDQLQSDLVFLRAQYMSSGGTIVGNLDMGLPANPFSTAQPQRT